MRRRAKRFALAERLYRLLLRLYPEAFRRRMGEAMVEAFRDSCAETVARRGWLGFVIHVAHACAEVAFQGLAERTASSHHINHGTDGPRADGPPDWNPRYRRRAGGGALLRDLVHDLRFGFRSLMKRPGFTLVAVLTIALGIGAATTIFSLVNGMLLQPLPYRDADQMVAVWPATWLSKPLFQLLEEEATSYDALAGWAPR